MAQDTLLGFPAHTLPYRRGEFQSKKDEVGDMSATKYQIFLKTVECGSFTKAAEELNFSQSGISHAISSLEEELGVTLLSRNRGGVTLTGDGRVPADELQKTIDRYNELCDKGTDVDFGKKSAYMHKIVTAPFWGIRKHIRVSSIDSGVNTNANGQALDADGNVIDGLYCVGNVGGVFYGGADYPFHQTGLSLGRCYTFGMLAAKHAMGQL